MAADQSFFNLCLLVYYLIIPPDTIHLLYSTTPYGKHYRPGWGPTIPSPLAWFLLESPTIWATLLLFPLGQNHSNPKAIILISTFLFHYFHRTIIYPMALSAKALRRKTVLSSPAGRKVAGGNKYPLSVAIMGLAFNLLNTYLQTRWVSHYADYEGDRWFWWRFPGGLVVFICGMAVNLQSDYALLGLKSEGGGEYKIPRGGWFELVSCPNYFGEIVEWLGWALMTWSWAGIGFCLYTSHYLVPRARQSHMWYMEKFRDDYPKHRKVVIPFIY